MHAMWCGMHWWQCVRWSSSRLTEEWIMFVCVFFFRCWKLQHWWMAYTYILQLECILLDGIIKKQFVSRCYCCCCCCWLCSQFDRCQCVIKQNKTKNDDNSTVQDEPQIFIWWMNVCNYWQLVLYVAVKVASSPLGKGGGFLKCTSN